MITGLGSSDNSLEISVTLTSSDCVDLCLLSSINSCALVLTIFSRGSSDFDSAIGRSPIDFLFGTPRI